MRYETTKELEDEEFKRATGVKRTTFEEMVRVIKASRGKLGRPTKLSDEDQLLLTLMYWREYRTEFHIGLTYGISESAVCRTIQKIENWLIAAKQFHLPGKKALKSSETEFEIVLIDATEQAVERPKKNSESTTVARKSAIHRKLNCLPI